MNQLNNKTPYGLLTREEQKQFCVEAVNREMYEVYEYGDWYTATIAFEAAYAYRLKLLPDEWYVISKSGVEIEKGKNISDKFSGDYIRPAKPHEMPKEKKEEPESLEDKIKKQWPESGVIMLFEDDDYLSYMLTHGPTEGEIKDHALAQSMKGFNGYVYESDGKLTSQIAPLGIGNFSGITGVTQIKHPIAVLFKKESK